MLEWHAVVVPRCFWLRLVAKVVEWLPSAVARTVVRETKKSHALAERHRSMHRIEACGRAARAPAEAVRAKDAVVKTRVDGTLPRTDVGRELESLAARPQPLLRRHDINTNTH